MGTDYYIKGTNSLVDIKLNCCWRVFGGDYVILVCRDEISVRPAGTDLTVWLHVEIKFCPGKVAQFSTWHLFVWNFFEFFFVTMSVYEIENP